MENHLIEVAVPQGYLSNHYFLYITASETKEYAAGNAYIEGTEKIVPQ